MLRHRAALFHFMWVRLLDLTGRSSIPILNAARRQPNVGPFWKCSDQSRRSFSAMHEDRFCCASNTTAAMCASPCFPVPRLMLNTWILCQVLMTLLTHQIDFVPSRNSVVPEDSMVGSPINGGGTPTTTFGVWLYP